MSFRARTRRGGDSASHATEVLTDHSVCLLPFLHAVHAINNFCNRALSDSNIIQKRVK